MTLTPERYYLKLYSMLCKSGSNMPKEKEIRDSLEESLLQVHLKTTYCCFWA